MERRGEAPQSHSGFTNAERHDNGNQGNVEEQAKLLFFLWRPKSETWKREMRGERERRERERKRGRERGGERVGGGRGLNGLRLPVREAKNKRNKNKSKNTRPGVEPVPAATKVLSAASSRRVMAGRIPAVHFWSSALRSRSGTALQYCKAAPPILASMASHNLRQNTALIPTAWCRAYFTTSVFLTIPLVGYPHPGRVGLSWATPASKEGPIALTRRDDRYVRRVRQSSIARQVRKVKLVRRVRQVSIVRQVRRVKQLSIVRYSTSLPTRQNVFNGRWCKWYCLSCFVMSLQGQGGTTHFTHDHCEP